jgi:hypothetical protein
VDPEPRVSDALRSLAGSGYFSENRTPSEVENQIAPSLPESYNYTAVISRRDVEKRRVEFSGSSSVPFDRSGDKFGIQLFVDQSSSMDVEWNGTQLVQEFSGRGYYQSELKKGSDTLEFSGSGELWVHFYNWSREGSLPSADSVNSVNQPLPGGREVRVLVWRDRSS